MSTFELDTPHQAKLQDVIVLSDKDRAPDTNPGVGLDFSMTVANDMLTLFDGGLRSALFTKTAASSAPAQATLEGVPAISDMPNLTGIGKAIGQFGWDLELTGYELTLDHGMGGPKSDITLEDCKLTNWRFKCKEGGSVEVKFRVESPDVNEKTHGKLALLKTREFPILLTAPVVQQSDIEEEHAAPARLKERTVTIKDDLLRAAAYLEAADDDSASMSGDEADRIEGVLRELAGSHGVDTSDGGQR